MLTIHRVHGVRRAHDGAPDPGHAVVVSGDRIEAVGPYEELSERYGDRARVRDWNGVLTPGRHEPDGAALLETAYHPDPREADDLGTAPLTGDALTALGMTDTRWGASARRGIQRLLSTGTTSLAGPFTRPAVRTAVARSGLRAHPAPDPLAPGAPADFAVFAEDGGCLVTVLGGRLVYRGRGRGQGQGR
ncbi:imidazolonepropionase-like domain-containing protein [Streptomyces chrestomyceticus]|uniref:imidazolonepropionase-like domain-containing protein n=1 Tax=Streptomyces chrestomyceticus TaxID=68185 RepID=UPI0033E5DD51